MTYPTISSGTTFTVCGHTPTRRNAQVEYDSTETIRGFVGQLRLEGEIAWQGQPRKTRTEAEHDAWVELLGRFGYEPTDPDA